MIAHRLSELFCSAEIFTKTAPEYKQALRNNSFSENINYLSQFPIYAPNNRKKETKSQYPLFQSSIQR